MTGKHTPGPWNLVWWGYEKYPYPLAILADDDGSWVARDGTVSSEANARLIAAAPEMLELVKMVHGSFGGGLVVTFSEQDAQAFAAAIAKAEGRE